MGLIGSRTLGGVSGGSSSALNTTGATLIVAWTTTDFGITPTFTDGGLNTYTELITQFAPADATGRMFYKISPTTSATHTFTLGGANTYGGAVVMVFDSTTIYDSRMSSATVGATNTVLQPGSLTPSVNNTLIVSGCGYNGIGTSVTVNSGFTRVDFPFSSGVHFGAALGYLEQTTAAAVNPTWTMSVAGGAMTAGMAVFQMTAPPAGGGLPPAWIGRNFIS